jgi:hypothetical protein
MTLADLIAGWKVGAGDVVAEDHGVVPVIFASMVWMISGGWVLGGALVLASTPTMGGAAGYAAVSVSAVALSFALTRALTRVVEIRWDGKGLRCSDGQVIEEADVERIDLRGTHALLHLRDARRRVQLARGVVILRKPRP